MDNKLVLDGLVFGSWCSNKTAAAISSVVPHTETFVLYPKEQQVYRLPYIFAISELEDTFYKRSHDIILAYAKDAWGLLIICRILLAYLILIPALQKWMRHRERYDLRQTLVVWNASLSVFSFLGAVRMIPEFVHVLSTYGLYHTVCSGDSRYTGLNLWGWLYGISKILELMDTVFIILRKQKLIFLHWYHHAVTMMYVWIFGSMDACSLSRWFMTMNFIIHAIMYAYYAVKASRMFKIPRRVNVSITVAQIMQMFIGFGLALWAISLKARGYHCEMSVPNLIFCNLMYLSYVVFFINYFFQSYVYQSAKWDIGQENYNQTLNNNINISKRKII